MTACEHSYERYEYPFLYDDTAYSYDQAEALDGRIAVGRTGWMGLFISGADQLDPQRQSTCASTPTSTEGHTSIANKLPTSFDPLAPAGAGAGARLNASTGLGGRPGMPPAGGPLGEALIRIVGD